MRGTQLASDIKYYLDYSKWNEELQRAETWPESVKRVMDMHRHHPKFQEAFKNPRFNELFDLTEKLYLEKTIIGSMRALQFGGAPIMKHNSKMFNCLGSNCDRADFFQEAMYWLMSGCGVGYSVQERHVNQLPNISIRNKGTKTFIVEDSIEGWADAFGVLLHSYFNIDGKFNKYHGYIVHFDYSLIRPKGAIISGGFKAPGHEGLKQSIERAEELINNALKVGNRLKPIHCYDIVCHMADAVLSGGVRRSATICLFSKEDNEMINAKTYINFNMSAGINKQRARSNNSVVLLRSETTTAEFAEIFEKIKAWGEPGFYFVDDLDQATNPCVEIGFWPYTIKHKSGWQGCNLASMNGGKLTTRAKLLEACIGTAFIGTLQAAYTDFKYVSKESKEIFDREALLGVSITGWMNSPDILLDEQNMKDGAKLVLEINAEVAKLIGINSAARTTCVKPEGNTSVFLETASGCHGEHDEMYLRLMQINKETEIAKYFNENNSIIIEESVWSSTKSDDVVYIPVIPKKGSIFKKDLVGIKQLEIVKKIQQNWVEYGTRHEAQVRPFLRHNVSNTVTVENWDEVRDFVYENKNYFSGVSFMGNWGDKDFKQAPFTAVTTPEKMLEKYGNGMIFASGLIVDGLFDFDNDLWDACAAVADRKAKLEGTKREVLLKKEWIRRAKQFAKRYFKGDINQMNYCLKDLHIYHRWVEINRELKPIDLSKINLKPSYTNVDTMGSAGCVGSACEMPAEYLEKFK